MANFYVIGPFAIPCVKKVAGRVICHKEFWRQSEVNEIAGEKGCYVFAVRAGKGYTPIYVGKATKTFKQECLNPSNRHKFQAGLADYKSGSPLLFFVLHPKSKGAANAKQIRQIEDFLIQNGAAKNPELQNIQGKGAPKWTIEGVIRAKNGKPTTSASLFKRVFDFHK